ncbi:MAG: TonB family protein [Chthoniobacterales bacterium]|nr:TonB family protein [Chthoniobacterales bacterium]
MRLAIARADAMRLKVFDLTLATFIALSCFLQADDAARVPDVARYFTYAPKPEYPELARETHLEGSGRFEGFIDLKTGAVTKVLVVQSTGYRVFDTAAIASIRRWQAKPDTIETFYVPLTFSMGGSVEAQLRAARAHTTYAPAPVYPYAMWRYGVHSGGRYQLTVDPETGTVGAVKVLAASRVLSFDQSCVKAFRQWRFVPHTVTTVRVPFSF